jgi:hypothetical protein
MHRLNELAARLTSAQVREVEDFAESLAARSSARVPSSPPRRISFEGWAGCLSNVDKSGVELAHEAADLVARKLDR